MAAVNPNSSFASKRLTRANYTGRSLLSQVGGRPNRTNNATKSPSNRDSDSSDDPLSTQETIKPNRAESTTSDGSSLSSVDDNELLEFDRQSMRRTTWSSRDLEYNLAQVDAAAKAEGSPRKRKRANTTVEPRQTPKRTKKKEPAQAKTPKNTEADDTPRAAKTPNLGGGWFSYPRKRVSAVYGSAKNPGFKGSPAGKLKPIPKPRFKFAKETAASGPDTAVHSSQSAPQFKFPRSFPGDTTPTSSMPTYSSRENEPCPEDLFDNDEDVPLSPLSSVSSTISLSLSPEDKRRLSSVEAPISFKCPVCDASVDAEFFKSFNLLKGVSVRKEAKFCRAHRARTAERTWAEKGYPEIDWDGLQTRIETHFAEIESILMMKKDSFFRNELEARANDKFTANKEKRSMKSTLHSTATSQGLEKITSGYYGSRGAKNMMESIISRFASKIRAQAPRDPLMHAVGASGFVQAVLVPELTVMLVKDDMNVGDDEARQIIRESMEIGDLLNEQPDDLVKVDAEEMN